MTEKQGKQRPPAFSWLAHDGPPASPDLPDGNNRVLIRYIFEGGKLARDARLVTFAPRADPSPAGTNGRREVVVTADEVLAVLVDDGVDMSGFYATAYEEEESGGAWVRLLPRTGSNAAGSQRPLTFTLSLPPKEDSPSKLSKRPRIDVKLCKEELQGRAAALQHYGA